jgi:hypothetical protein
MILDVHPGSWIQIYSIPDPGYRGRKNTGSLIRNTRIKQNVNTSLRHFSTHLEYFGAI